MTEKLKTDIEIRTLEEMEAEFPALAGRMRHLAKYRRANGLAGAFLRFGGKRSRLYVDVAEFFRLGRDKESAEA